METIKGRNYFYISLPNDIKYAIYSEVRCLGYRRALVFSPLYCTVVTLCIFVHIEI